MNQDDLLLCGKTEEEHNNILDKENQRAKDYCITLNKDKCEFGVENLEFCDYIYTGKGLTPSPEKVNIVKEA